MKSVPRILPIVAVTIGGVLAINALSGVRDLPQLLSGARAFAEGLAAPKADAKKAGKAKDALPKEGDKAAAGDSAKADGKDATATADQAAPADAAAPGTSSPYAESIMSASNMGVQANAAVAKAQGRSAAICAPTAAELAKEAGMSPAELRVLQSLGTRRGQLDQREKDIDVQLQLLAAAEAKLDGKIRTLNGLKGQVQSLLGQADAQQQAENDRLIRIYESMKPKDAASRFTLLDDSVRLPIATKMKEKSLSAILAQMSPADAKTLTEKLANRFSAARAMADARAAVTPTAPGAANAPAAKPAAGKAAPGKAAPGKAG